MGNKAQFIQVEVPVPGSSDIKLFGSDAIAAMLRSIRLPYVALNPGASFRGLHDSLVNYLGNTAPKMILALHEETAVAIAHGYAKASGQMMAVILHSNVGLMHGSMSIFNAWCDRVPIFLLGATGPVDAAKRRPWIDWLHTSADQAAIIRDFVKWDDQPSSISAAQESMLRAAQIALTGPQGPTYVNLDVELQELELSSLPPAPDIARFRPPPEVVPHERSLEHISSSLSQAQHPVVLVGRVGRSEAAWQQRVALAERLNSAVICDLKTGATFPTDHRLLAGPPGIFLAREAKEVLRSADVILSLDWIDLGGTLQDVFGEGDVGARVIHVSLDQYSHRGLGKEYFALPPVDEYLLCNPDLVVPLLVEKVSQSTRDALHFDAMRRQAPEPLPHAGPISMKHLADALADATFETPVCIARLPLGWNGGYRHFRHPLDFLGYDGGAGVGSGPGMAVGAALALLDASRVAVAVLGDGDFMMSSSAIWTAAHYRIPLLMIVANNRSFYNDELHQERIAALRGRPTENKGIGQAIASPDIDIAALASAQGAIGMGPIDTPLRLRAAIGDGLAAVQSGKVVVIDAHIAPGYDADLSGSDAAAHRRNMA